MNILYYSIENMAWKVDDRILEDQFINLMIEKANIIKDHLRKSMHPLIIVANIGPTMAVYKFYDTNGRRFSQAAHDSF